MRLRSLRAALPIALLAVALPARGAPSPGADVAGLLALAATSSPELAAAALEADAAGARATAAGALPDPRLRTELLDLTREGQQNPTLSPWRTGSARYTLMQEIPAFGKRELKREVAQYEAADYRERVRLARAELAARIKTVQAQRWWAAETRALLGEILDLLQRIESIARTRYASGLVAQQDVIRAQTEVTATRSELIAIEAEEHHLHARLNALLGRPPEAPLAAAGKPRALPAADTLDAGALARRAQENSPRLAALDARWQGAQKTRELTYRNRGPEFSLGVAANQFGNALKQWDLMLEINIPLQQSARRAEERAVEALADAARERRVAAGFEILAETSENLAALVAAQRTATLAWHTLLPQAELAYRSALAGYEAGRVEFVALLEAQRQLRQAKQISLKAEAEAQARGADLERLTGEDL